MVVGKSECHQPRIALRSYDSATLHGVDLRGHGMIITKYFQSEIIFLQNENKNRRIKSVYFRQF